MVGTVLSWLMTFFSSSLFRRVLNNPLNNNSVVIANSNKLEHDHKTIAKVIDSAELTDETNDKKEGNRGHLHQEHDTKNESDLLHLDIQKLTPVINAGKWRNYEASAGIIWMHGQNAPISRDMVGGELPYLYEQCNVVNTLIKNRHQL